MLIVGINAYHGDASACIVRDGKLLAAAEEERFRRIKHWAGFPSEAIRYCLSEAKATIGDVDSVAINSDPRANRWRRVGYVLGHRPDLGLVLDRLRNRGRRLSIEAELERAFPGQQFRGTVQRVEHHHTHLASSFLASPFDKAAVVSVDGFGDFASAAWGVGEGCSIRIDNRVYFPHSLGIFYQAMTQFLGFPHYGDEYKVMGLAPYGQPTRLDAMRQIVKLADDGSYRLELAFFRHHKELVAYEWADGSPKVGDLFSPQLEKLLGPRRKSGDALEQHHRDIARSVQAMYEEAFFHLLDRLHEKSGLTNLALAGGCAMNSVANGKVARQTAFRNVYAPAAAGDAGGAIGAALAVWQEAGGGRSFVMDHAYWGPHFTQAEIKRVLHAKRDDSALAKCHIEQVDDEDALCGMTAQAITEGQVVGWFHGRMEWGPRALGNRSILGDPRRADMKDILNAKIKRRESFRPFAPSILREQVRGWFEEEADVPFMTQVFQIRPEKRSLIPAVTHVDGSGRLQTVARDCNPRYYKLIEAFMQLTGVPMLLNTSFNENEPVVCEPAQALDCFLRTNMDMLVLENIVVRRQQTAVKDADEARVVANLESTGGG